ncbi:3-oxoacyl-[acyl-carrier-protein] reductase FabG [Ensifer psoraleae]|uniref:SDR family NAD(P)-dependent oxidoreductase n=1 Tax=Sinorhizobium psoraleae TaxID=520838 RepID=UPI001567EE39|nr:SDR family oxidoreductase [Sinorhizobium psoraleae]NRP74478.1 3-oxoacyl-[acyl-carrier-protein] reductase FabG [Sinorhizobium psoraleae]
MTQGTALITGASSGIGAVYAERLARRGHDLILVARDFDRLKSLANRLSGEHGAVVTPLIADLTSAADLERVVAKLRTDAGISLLVNCAGIGPNGPLLASDPNGLSKMVQLNVDVLHSLNATAANAFARRRNGAIINIASAVALMPERFNATYVATKAFVLALTQALSAELEPHGVRMQAVLPGFTRTEIFDRAGIDISVIPADMMMDAGEMVDAALAGFDRGEVVTIPSLADSELWEQHERTRRDLGPHLSLKHAAARYRPGGETR